MNQQTVQRPSVTEKHLWESCRGPCEKSIRQYSLVYPDMEPLAFDLFLMFLRGYYEPHGEEQGLHHRVLSSINGNFHYMVVKSRLRHNVHLLTLAMPDILKRAAEMIYQVYGGESQCREWHAKKAEQDKKHSAAKPFVIKMPGITVKISVPRKRKEPALPENVMLAAVSSILEEIGKWLQRMNALDVLMKISGKQKGEHRIEDGADRYTEAMRLMENQHFLKLVDRMSGILEKQSAISAARRVSIMTNKTVMTLGNDLESLVPSEYAMGTISPCLFAAKFCDMALQMVKTEEDRSVRGPVVCCVDASGSMSHQDFDYWARAISLGVVLRCMETQRDAHIILFSSSEEDLRIYSWTPQSYPSLRELVEYAGYKINGGTDFTHVLQRAMNIIRGDGTNHSASGIVMLTDGYDRMGEEFVEKFVKDKKELNVKLTTMIVSREDNAELKAISDSYFCPGGGFSLDAFSPEFLGEVE